MFHIRLNAPLGPPTQPWPLWLLAAIPIAVTALWLTLATLAVVFTAREWQRMRGTSAQR